MVKGSKGLLNFVESVAGDKYLQVEEDLGEGFFRLRSAELERRQAKHDIQSVEDIVVELLRNSRDAGSSKVFIASSKEEVLRKIVVIDDGCGIPSSFQEKIFEPRVTTRLENPLFDEFGLHGRGIALFSVKQQAEQARVTFSFPGEGSIVKAEINLKKIPERKDQSTYPLLKRQGNFWKAERGPHNILRVVTEFNLNHPELAIYLGSPAEIFATMRKLSPKEPSKPKKKIYQKIAEASSTKTFLEMARRYYGLELSLRNAHRILKEEIKPLPPLLELVARLNSGPKRISRKDLQNLARFISEEDLGKISQLVAQSLQPILNQYYLRLADFPQIFKEKNRLKIFLELGKEDEV